MIASDGWFSHQVSDNRTTSTGVETSFRLALYSLIGVAGGSYMWGLDDKKMIHCARLVFCDGGICEQHCRHACIKGITQRRATS